MQKTTLLTLTIIALLLLNLGTLAVVWRQHPGGHGRPDFGGPRPDHRAPPGRGPARQISEFLDFDDGQEAKFRTLRDRHHARTLALRREARHLHQRLYQTLLDSSATSRRDSLLTAIAANERERAHLNLTHFSELRALCRPDQRTRFSELMARVSDQFAQEGHPPLPGPPPDEPRP